MTRLLSYILQKEHFILSAERTLFWEDQRTLIVADVHAGKTGHFRKSGINIPQSVYKDDMHRLLAEILFFKAEKLIIVGDLTHSIANREMDLFRKWRKDFPALEVHLAKGNHDILDNKWYEEADIVVHNEPLIVNGFSFIHDITRSKEFSSSDPFIFSGHVHPIISMRGRGKQSLHFPCFYFAKQYCILPAFSRFTGGYKIEPRKGEDVFALAEKEILPFQNIK
ncbi:MAG: ligase-associated DNA damage response endonuclease PdeM [Chitinophagaceae bacterium]